MIFKGENNLDYLDGISIIIAVVVVVLVGSITNYQKEKKFHSLNDFEQKSAKYNVIRNGMNQYVVSEDLLVGDLVKINYGEILPCPVKNFYSSLHIHPLNRQCPKSILRNSNSSRTQSDCFHALYYITAARILIY